MHSKILQFAMPITAQTVYYSLHKHLHWWSSVLSDDNEVLQRCSPLNRVQLRQLWAIIGCLAWRTLSSSTAQHSKWLAVLGGGGGDSPRWIMATHRLLCAEEKSLSADWLISLWEFWYGIGHMGKHLAVQCRYINSPYDNLYRYYTVTCNSNIYKYII